MIAILRDGTETFCTQLLHNCLLKAQVVNANRKAFSDIMVNSKILTRLVHFSIQFLQGKPNESCGPAAFRSSDMILFMPYKIHSWVLVAICQLLTCSKASLIFHSFFQNSLSGLEEEASQHQQLPQ